MSSSRRPRPPIEPEYRRPTTARERVNARRAARRAESVTIPWRPIMIASVVLLIAVLVGVLGSALRRADQAISTIQQEDPRLRAPSPIPLPTDPPQLTPLPAGPVIDPRPTDPLREPTAVATLPPDPELPATLQKPVTVLLLGVDRRPDPNDGVRSDTMILVHLNARERWASMLSIPRDTMATIPRLGLAKINTAYGYGYANAEALYGIGTQPEAAGGALVAETLESLLNVRVDYIAQIDFSGFERLVDSIGGVVVDVPTPLLDPQYPTEFYSVERVYIPAGLQVMNGRTALTYARSRHSTSDFDRSRRQQQVLRAVLDQVRARGILENAGLIPRWLDVLEQNVRTTLPLRDLEFVNALVGFARRLEPGRIATFSVNPNDVALVGEHGTDLYWNPADLVALVARWRAGPQIEPPTPDDPVAATPVENVRVQVLNGAGVSGLAGQVSAFLAGYGFAMTQADDAPGLFENTLVIDYTGRPQEARRVAEALGIEPRFVRTQPAPDLPTPSVPADIVVVVGVDYQQEWIP